MVQGHRGKLLFELKYRLTKGTGDRESVDFRKSDQLPQTNAN